MYQGGQGVKIAMTINHKAVEYSVEPDQTLADVLRANGLLSIRQACETGNCGLCTVWMDGKPVLSCSTLAYRAQGKAITTIEGVETEARTVAELLVEEGADQCGFCSPGLIMTVLAMKRELPEANEEDIKNYLSGNLCRCTGYASQMRGIKRYMEVE
jgi:carbon-monoxide dehydrogenase small subunit